MRILRVPTDFRVVEQFDETMLSRAGDHLVYSVSSRGLNTAESAARLADAAGVPLDAISYAGQKPKDGVSGQVFSVHGGEPISMRGFEFVARRIGVADRPVEASDITGNAYEIVVRDLQGDDMRRLRHNMAQVRDAGLPSYFDDQRFGCLRHGQGYIVRNVLRGRFDLVLQAVLAAPSPYGAEMVERYKAQIRENWGDWRRLVSISNGRRGKSAFEHLLANEGDFLGALRVGVSSRERTMHLYAYQSHLFNRALASKVRQIAQGENLAWLPCDEGSLPVWRELSATELARLAEAKLMLPGPGMENDPDTVRLYAPIFESEGITMEQFCALDIPGFRPIAEERPVLMQPEYLRAAPAQDDEYYPRSRKMRVRFTLPRGQYPNLVLKRLLMPTESDSRRLCMWISRHPLVWPKDDGTPQVFDRVPLEERRSQRAKGSYDKRDGNHRAFKRASDGEDRRPARDDRGGERRPAGGDRGGREDRSNPWGGARRRDRRDDRRDDRRPPRQDDRRSGPSPDRSSPWGNRD